MTMVRFVSALALTVIATAPAAAAVTTTSPGKTAVHATETSGLAANGDINDIYSTISKGKAKTVVEVNATVSVNASASVSSIYVYVSVNGYAANPLAYAQQCDPAATTSCTVSGAFWFDIDALEIAHPGEFVGQPIIVHLLGGNSAIAGAGTPYTATITARMGKK